MNVSLASYDFRLSALLLSIMLQYLRASLKLSSNIASLQLGSEQLEALRVDSIHHNTSRTVSGRRRARSGDHGH